MRSSDTRPGTGGRRVRVAAVGAAIAFLVAADASSVSAEATDPPNATPGCSAFAQVEGGERIDPYVSSGVFTIPREGSASYEGRVGAGGEGPIRDFDGKVEIATPPGLPSISLTDSWNWEGGSGPGREDSGTVTWELPDVVPAGVPLKVEGYHAEEGVRCEGFVKVQIEGGVFDSPVGIISVGGTAVAAAGLGFSMVPKRRGAV